MKITKETVTDVITSIIYILLFIILGIITFLVLMPRKRIEGFENVSSRSLYKTSNNFESDVSGLATILADANDSLITAGCYQFDGTKAIQTYMPKDCLWTSFGIYTSSFDEVRSKILSTLKTVAGRVDGKRIDSQIFVLISQAPYMRDDNGNVIAVQYNISSYGFNPKFGKNTSSMPLYIEVYIIISDYDKWYKKKSISTNVLAALSAYRTNKDQCFVKCVNDTTSSYCGCLNTTRNRNKQSYTASCSSTPDLKGDTNTSINKPANFGVLYRINPTARLMAESSIFRT